MNDFCATLEESGFYGLSVFRRGSKWTALAHAIKPGEEIKADGATPEEACNNLALMLGPSPRPAA